MKYYLTEIKLTDESNYSARVQVDVSHNLDGIINLILNRRNLVSRTDLVAVLNAFFESIQECIERGEGVNLPLFNLGYSISGVFDNDEDMFDEEQHRIKVNLNDGVLITQAIENIKPTKIDAIDTAPDIKYFKDLSSGTTNKILTPNSIFEITGKRLKLAGDDASVGLYFVAENGTETKVNLIAGNANKKLIAQAPTLIVGTYRLRLRTQYSGGHMLKEPKEHTSAFTLTVR
jgi:hypothetical protein